MTFIALLLAGALVVAPGATGSLLAGPPLTLAGKILLTLLVTTAVGIWMLPVRRVPRLLTPTLACLVLLKLTLASMDVPPGWLAQVYVDNPREPVSFFWQYGERPYRIDPAVDFEGAAFGLHSLNDIHHNSGEYSEGRRDDVVPWRATWDGYIHAPAHAEVSGTISGAGRVELHVDGQVVLQADNPTDVPFIVETGVCQSHVRVAYDKPANTRPALRLAWTGRKAPRVAPFAGQTSDSRPQGVRAVLTSLVVGAGVLWTLGVMGVSAWRSRADVTWRADAGRLAVVCGFAVIAAGSVLLSHRHAGDTYHMSSGNDPIVYEGNARDIMANGLLMLRGRALGAAEPYFHYPLYPYVMAAFHWLIGEDPASVMLGNGLLIAAVIPLLWSIGWPRLRGFRGVVVVAAATWIVGRYVVPYAPEVFTDHLFLPLVLAALSVGCWAARTDRLWPWTLTGLLIALGAAARPSLLTYLPFLLIAVVWMGWKESRWLPAGRASAGLLIGFAGGMLPFTLRNYYVSGQFVMLVNSWVGLAVFLVPPGETYESIYSGNALTLSESVAQAWRIVVDHPMRTIDLEVRKLLFTFGVTSAAPGQALIPAFVLVSVAGLTALARRAVDSPILLVTVPFAISHIVAMVLAAPWTYGYKSILPLQLVLLCWAGLMLSDRHRTD